MEDIKTLLENWEHYKAMEVEAQESRRFIESLLTQRLNIPQGLDGCKTFKIEGRNVKVTGRVNRKVNSDTVAEIAAENGVTEHLHSLFKWTPTINMRAWKACDPAITKVLEQAITTSESKPSYKIELLGE